MPWGVAAAAVAAGGAVYASSKQAKAAKKAANAQTDAADSANDTQLQIFNQQRDDQAPFRQAGLTGLNQYMQLLGLPTNGSGQYGGGTSSTSAGTSSNPFVSLNDQGVPSVNSSLYQSDPAYKQAWDRATAEHQSGYGKSYQTDSDLSAINSRLNTLYSQYSAQQPAATQSPAQTQQDAFAQFRSTPGYQFGLDEGTKAVQASAAARGGLNSGATLKALQQYGTNYADQQGYTPYMNKLASLAGIGQTATNQTGAYGTNYANQVGQNLTNAGNATAQGIYGSANSWANGASQVAGAAGQYLGSQYKPAGSSSSNATLSDGMWGGI